jgi:hypothetical protein
MRYARLRSLPRTAREDRILKMGSEAARTAGAGARESPRRREGETAACRPSRRTPRSGRPSSINHEAPSGQRGHRNEGRAVPLETNHESSEPSDLRGVPPAQQESTNVPPSPSRGEDRLDPEGPSSVMHCVSDGPARRSSGRRSHTLETQGVHVLARAVPLEIVSPRSGARIPWPNLLGGLRGRHEEQAVQTEDLAGG